MARVHHRKARKDYPDHGIKKGDMYYFAQVKTGPRSSRTIRQMAPIKPQQLTGSAFKSALLDWEETKSALGDMDDAQGLADTIRELGEEQTSNKEAMPDGLQSGDTGQMLETRAEACETAAAEIEQIISDWESARDEHADLVTAFEEYETELAAWEELNDDAGKPDEVEDPGEFDEDEFLDKVREVEVNE